jgi:tetratricopeptide (TPR) repeat protein
MMAVPGGSAPGASAVEADLQWAMGAMNQGRPDDAERFARNVLARIPQHPKALYLLGCALMQQNRAGQAVPALEKAARALQDPAVETGLASALRHIGRAEDAIVVLRRAVKRRPPHPDAFHELAHSLYAAGREDEAMTVLTHACEVVPAAPELPILLGVLHQGRGDRAAAKAAYAKALAVAPGHPGAHYGLGSILADEADYAEAVRHLEQARAGNPNDPQAYMRLGVCLLELGQCDAALENFRAALRRDRGLYRIAVSLISASARGRFWLRPSAVAARLLSD